MLALAHSNIVITLFRLNANNNIVITLLRFDHLNGQVLMGGLAKSEDKRVCILILRKFAVFFKKGMKIAFTDQDSAWEAAFKFVMANLVQYSLCNHLICSWHLGNHVRGYCKKVFGNDKVAWKAFFNMFWSMVNFNDSASASHEDTFAAKFYAWHSLLMRFYSDTEAFNSALAFLERTFAARHQWAGIFTNALPKLGTRSTQRAESVHGKMQTYLVSDMLMLECSKAYCANMSRVDDHQKAVVNLQIVHLERRPIPAVLLHLRKAVSPFCMSKILDEFQESCNYTLQPWHVPGTWLVRRLGTLAVDDDECLWKAVDHMTPARLTRIDCCSCRMVQVMGYGPCRHMAKVRPSYCNIVITLLFILL